MTMKNSARIVFVCLIILCRSLSVCLVSYASDTHEKYSTYSNARFSYSISYPADLLLPQGEADNGDGQRFTSRDKRAEMIVYGGYALDRSLRDLYNEELRGGDDDHSHSKKTVTYKVLRDNWFVVSGYN